jgi:large subunit ribosomal protein L23
MKKTVIVKPMITEKAENLSERLNQYCFVVHRSANKVEIKKAVEELYQVTVESVNTMVMPGKMKRRNTRAGLINGQLSAYKKAIVKLGEGEEIDFFGDI